MDGKKEGKGKYEYTDGTYHEGIFKDDEFCEGKGLVKYVNGSVYEGKFIDGKRWGKGKLTNANGTISHDGKWINNKPKVKATTYKPLNQSK